MEFRRVQPHTAPCYEGAQACAANVKNSDSSTFAFVATLWASAPEQPAGSASSCDQAGLSADLLSRYCLDALVLGHSFQRVESCYDRVLMCTSEALDLARSMGWLELLHMVGWKTLQIEPVKVADILISKCRKKFSGCFAKLRALALHGYTRVALMDLDMVVRQNVDCLADPSQFPAPMAAARVNWRNRELQPGEQMYSRDFFDNEGKQRYGVNAGLSFSKPQKPSWARCLRASRMGVIAHMWFRRGPSKTFSLVGLGTWTGGSI